MQDPADKFEGLAEEIARRAQAAGLTVAAAESLTTGAISNALGAAPGASEWLRGGVVAYATGVKRAGLALGRDSGRRPQLRLIPRESS